MSALTRELTLTVFPTVSGTVKIEDAMPFERLVQKVKEPKSYPDKASMPLLVLWRCGNSRTDAGCLRHEGNIIALSGVLVDYDAGISVARRCGDHAG